MAVGPGAVDVSTQGTVRVATSTATIVSQLAASAAGDTVQIAAGTYAQVVTSRSVPSGLIRVVPAPGATVTIAGVNLTGAQGLDWRGINTTAEVRYSSTVRCRWRGGISTPGATVVGHNIRESCSDLVIEDATVTDPDCGFFLYADRDTLASDNITIQRCRVNNVAQDHIFIGRGTNVVIQDCELFGNIEDPEHSDGVQIVGGKGVTIRRNHIRCTRAFRDGAIDRNDHGIICNYDPGEVGGGGTAGRVPENITIENNLIHDQTSHGITLAGVLGCTIRNNTVYDNGLSGTELALSVAPDAGNTISNLVLVNNIFNKISISGVTPATNTHNFVADGSGPAGTNRLTGTPGFVDNTTAAALDYSPATGSQNLTSGTTSGAPATDLLGATRPSPPSRGALEQTSSSGGGGGGAPVPAVIRATTAAGSVDSASSTVTKPAGTVSGDLLLALHFATADGAAASMTAPSGFAQQGTTHTVTDGTFGMHGKVWAKTAGGSEPANYTFAASSSSDGNAVLLICVQSGTFDPAAPFAVTPTWGGAATAAGSQVAPAIDPPTTDTRMVSGWASTTFNNACTYTVPASMVELVDYQPVGNYIAAAAGSELLAADTATGTRTATASRPSYHATVSLALAPAPATAAEVTGTATAPLGVLTSTAAAVRVVAGSAVAPLGAVVSVAAGTRTVAGSAVSALGGLASSAVGVRTVTAAATAPLGGLVSAVSATKTVTGSAVSPLGGVASTAAATRTLAATAGSPLGALASTATASRATAGAGAAALGALTSTATAARDTAGAATSPLGEVTSTAQASRDVDATPTAALGGLVSTAAGATFTNTATADLGPLVSGTVGVRDTAATATTGLGVLVSTADAVRDAPAAAVSPLGGLDSSLSATVLRDATTTALLGGLDSTATAVVDHTGTAVSPLGALVSAGVGVVDRAGTAVAVLGGLVSHTAAAGTADTTAALGPLTSSATADRNVLAAAAVGLGPLTSAAAASRGTSGAGSSALGDLTSAAGAGRVVAASAVSPLGGVVSSAVRGVSDSGGAAVAPLGVLVSVADLQRTAHAQAVAVLGSLLSAAGAVGDVSGVAVSPLGGLVSAGSDGQAIAGWPPLVEGPYVVPLVLVEGPFVVPLVVVEGPFTAPLVEVTE